MDSPLNGSSLVRKLKSQLRGGNIKSWFHPSRIIKNKSDVSAFVTGHGKQMRTILCSQKVTIKSTYLWCPP